MIDGEREVQGKSPSLASYTDPKLQGKGLVLSFEGIDASGKKTQSLLLHEWMRSMGVPCEYISFPDYDTNIGREITSFLSRKKEYPLEAAHMLYALNRLEHKKEITKWIGEGRAIVINRYCDSNIAYGGASGLSLDWLQELESEMPQADYVFYLRGTAALSEKRKSTNRDRFERDSSFLSRVSLIYDALCDKRANWIRINADDSIENIRYEISRLTERLFLEKGIRGNGNKSDQVAVTNTLDKRA